MQTEANAVLRVGNFLAELSNFIPDNIKLGTSIIIFLRLLQRLEGSWSERGQRHRPRGGGGVQCHQAGGSLVQADQVVGPERS